MSQLSFEQIEQQLRTVTTEKEQRLLDALSDRDWEKYRDAVTELYMQKFFHSKIERVIRSAGGHGKKKPGSHGEDKHK